MKRKTLLVIGGGIESIPGIKKAKDMGYYIIVTDGNKNAPGLNFADEFFVKSTYDIKGNLEIANRINKKRILNGVICFSTDVPLTVATIAHKLKLNSISVETAKICTNKLEMKKRFKETGIPTPWFSKVESMEDITLGLKKFDDVVIKPIDSRGSRGVQKISQESNIEKMLEHSKKMSPSSQIIIEEFLTGNQYSTESIIINGKCTTVGFSERNYDKMEEFFPYFIENGGQQPPTLDNDDINKIKNLIEDVSCAIGITSGIVKGDIVMTENGPKVIEVATRLSGGWFSSDQIPLNSGIDILKIAVKLCVGKKIHPDELISTRNMGVAIRYFFPKIGKIKEIKNVKKFEKKPWVHKLEFFQKEGDFIEKQTDHTKRCGFVITIGKTKEIAVLRAQKVVNEIKIIVQ